MEKLAVALVNRSCTEQATESCSQCQLNALAHLRMRVGYGEVFTLYTSTK